MAANHEPMNLSRDGHELPYKALEPAIWRDTIQLSRVGSSRSEKIFLKREAWSLSWSALCQCSAGGNNLLFSFTLAGDRQLRMGFFNAIQEERLSPFC